MEGNRQIDIFDFEGFIDKNMTASNGVFEFQNLPIQIYPLSMATRFLKSPSPLFRTQYNFLLLFTEGGGEQQVDNNFYSLEPYDVLFIREGHLNAIKSILPNTNGYYIHIDNTIISEIFKERLVLNRFTFSPKNSISFETMKWLSKCSELILEHLFSNSNDRIVPVVLLQALVQKLSTNWPTLGSKMNRNSEVTSLFKELLYENFKSQRELKFYANSLSISENHLNRCVKATTNKPPKQHINELVIFNSKVQLQDLRKSISEVAYDLGFADPSYFGRLFKQITQMQPSEYRAKVQSDLSDQTGFNRES
ncbi:MAG: helix-turn-helix domain-containing protein [Bacteroidota bacterium]